MLPRTAFWLGRQPILDAMAATVGYELLFRSDPGNAARIDDNRMATANVINHAFSELGIAAVLGECRGFINFDGELLMSDVVELLPPERTVIELLEGLDVTQPVIERCRDLRSRGFSFALDDIVQLDDLHAPLLSIIDVVKIDVLATPASELQDLVLKARSTGRVKLLAEKVDTRAQADRCRELGFDLFQGYFFARPVIMEGRRTDPSKRLLLRLLEQSLDEKTDTADIEDTFKQAPDLSYKLMRLVNSVGMGLRSPIQSLSHAVQILGRRQLQRWLQVLLFANQTATDFPSPLLQLAAGRGKLMELMTEKSSRDAHYHDQAFMTGILSLLDTLLEMPMTEVIGQLHLPDEVRAALVQRNGRLGRLLLIVEALERTDDAEVATLLADGDPCTTVDLPKLQIEALSWSNRLGQSGESDAKQRDSKQAKKNARRG
ncbi:MAG TPA: EAL domain-containing protein [Gammaproteobacteria bacterium]|nr:EAL domain-containing protein [Gammaproteobacteria bacterium]